MNKYPDTQCVSLNRNALHAIIKNFRDAFPHNFDQCGLQVCPVCKGSGLPIPADQREITFWQPDEYCGECKGFGVIGITKIYDEYLCKGCRGSGCKMCGDRGSVDWISNIVKKR
jgi:hypothetical protein